MLIQTKKITKSFQCGPTQVQALVDATLDIQSGEFTALVGPSGSGKTTLLNLIGCLDKPDYGTIMFRDQDVTRLSKNQLAFERLHHIGFIFQDYNLIPTLTVRENVEYVLWMQGVSSSDRRSKAQRTLDRVGLGGLVNRRPKALSRGQQQRVAISRAIAHQPKVVLGDELTANLDHKTGTALMEFLKELNKEDKITFLFATHDPVMMEYANRIVRLHDGKITQDDTR